MCGIHTATGVVGLTLPALLVIDLQDAMVVSTGALCTNLTDLPSPLWYKLNEMMTCVLLMTAITFLVAVVTPYTILPVVVVVANFLAGLVVAYDNKTMPLQFAALFVMMLTFIEGLTLRKAVECTLQSLLGAIGYVAFAMAMAWGQHRRIKEQVLTEYLCELAMYVECKVGLYDASKDLDEQSNTSVRQ